MLNKAPSARMVGAIMAISLIIISTVLWSLVPQRADSYAPFPLHGNMGEHIVGRNISITVRNVYASHRIFALDDYGEQDADQDTQGYWVVIDYVGETVNEEAGFDTYLRSGKYTTGVIPKTRAIHVFYPGIRDQSIAVFDIPEIGEMNEFVATNSIMYNTFDLETPLDSQVVIPIPKSSIQFISAVTVQGVTVRQ